MSLYGKILDSHVKLIREYFPLLEVEKAPRVTQDDSRTSSWPKRTPVDGIIDWAMAARNLYDWVRALTEPYPGAFTYHGDRKLIIWKCGLLDENGSHGEPGSIIDVDADGIVVAAGEGAVKLTSLQFQGQERFSGKEIHEAFASAKGEMLG